VIVIPGLDKNTKKNLMLLSLQEPDPSPNKDNYGLKVNEKNQ